MNPQFSQAGGSVSKDVNKQSIARVFGVKVSDVAYLKAGLVVDSYKVLYDKKTQTCWYTETSTGTVSSWAISGETLTLTTSVGVYPLRIAIPYRISKLFYTDINKISWFPNMVVDILGKTESDKSGYGQFYYDPTDTTSVADNATIFVTTDGKRIKRIYKGEALSSWFSSYTDINTFLSKGNVRLLFDNSWTQTSSLVLKSNTTIKMLPGVLLTPGTTPIQSITAIGTLNTSATTTLSADAPVGANQIVVTNPLSFNVGDWIELRSEALVEGPNAQGVKQAHMRQITKIDTNTLYLDKAISYIFKVSDNSMIYKLNIVENITVDGVNLNNINYTNQYTIGMNFVYGNNISVINSTVFGSKDKYTGDVDGRSAIKFNSCRNVLCEKSGAHHQGWYGVEVLGYSEDVTVRKGYFDDCRHAISINWSAPYGEPNGCLIDDCTSSTSRLSSFDTHDVGKNLVFQNCRAYKSGDDGYQIRALNVKYINCISENAAADGFGQGDGAMGTRIINCKASYSVRNGFSLVWEGGNLENCEAINNQYGYAILGGRLLNCRGIDNTSAVVDCGSNADPANQYTLYIDNCDFPASAIQTRCFYFRGSNNIRPELVTIKNCNLAGYGNFWYLLGGYSTQPLPPMLENNTLDTNTVANPTSGIATLVGGTITINTTAVRLAVASTASSLKFVSNIKIKRLLKSSTVGGLYVDSIVNGTSFTVKSDNASDASTFYWEISL